MSDQVKPFPLITEAIRRHDCAAMVELFQCHPDMLALNVPAFGSWLHYAAAYGSVEIVDRLVAMGFEPDRRNPREGENPLVHAAANGRVDIAKYLMSVGAQLDIGSAIRNPLFGAILGRSQPVAALLLDAGMDLSATYRLGSSSEKVDAIAFAMLQGERDIAHLIAAKRHFGDSVATHEAVSEGLRVAKAVAVQ